MTPDGIHSLLSSSPQHPNKQEQDLKCTILFWDKFSIYSLNKIKSFCQTLSQCILRKCESFKMMENYRFDRQHWKSMQQASWVRFLKPFCMDMGMVFMWRWLTSQCSRFSNIFSCTQKKTSLRTQCSNPQSFLHNLIHTQRYSGFLFVILNSFPA